MRIGVFEMIMITLNLFLLIGTLIIPLILQIYLSKRENKYLGLILPVISGIIAGIMSLSIATFSAIESNGSIVTSQTMGFIPFIGISFVFFIPMIIFIIIYKICRKKLVEKSEIEKMNIKDL